MKCQAVKVDVKTWEWQSVCRYNATSKVTNETGESAYLCKYHTRNHLYIPEHTVEEIVSVRF